MFFKFCDAFARVLDKAIIVLGLILLFAVGIQIAGRYIWFIPLWLWPQEAINFSLIWSIFIGSIVCLRENKHFCVDIFQLKGPSSPALNRLLRILHYAVVICMTAVFIYYGWLYFWKWGRIQESDITGINLGWQYFSVPFAGVSWLLFIIEGIYREFFLGILPLDHGSSTA